MDFQKLKMDSDYHGMDWSPHNFHSGMDWETPSMGLVNDESPVPQV